MFFLWAARSRRYQSPEDLIYICCSFFYLHFEDCHHVLLSTLRHSIVFVQAKHSQLSLSILDQLWDWRWSHSLGKKLRFWTVNLERSKLWIIDFSYSIWKKVCPPPNKSFKKIVFFCLKGTFKGVQKICWPFLFFHLCGKFKRQDEKVLQFLGNFSLEAPKAPPLHTPPPKV